MTLRDGRDQRAGCRRAGRLFAVMAALGLLLLSAPTQRALAADAPSLDVSSRDAIGRAWKRTDKPVAAGMVTRTWMWGPALTLPLSEPSQDAPGGQRTVQYFDKSRMEVGTATGADPSSIWFITNGLLARELVTGQVQLGSNVFETHAPADINIAGDPDDPDGATYASFARQLAGPATADGATVTARIARDGSVTNDASLAQYGVTAGYRVNVPGLNHQVASVFWSFMNTGGLVYDQGTYQNDQLFENPFYATG
jgi:hypothetical protein